MENLTIREAAYRDYEQLGELNFMLIQDEGHENKMDSHALTRRMAGWLSHEYRCFVTTQTDNGIVAYALFKSTPAGTYLRQLFVLKAYRRQGIASHLLDFLFAEVWKEKEVRLDVLVNNQQAISFYKRYGLELYCHTFRRAAS